jgi:hypothetical protein
MKLFAFLLINLASLSATASNLPSSTEMQTLKPALKARIQAFDKLAPSVAAQSALAHSLYASPENLSDLNARLERVSKFSDHRYILNNSEWTQFEKNLVELREIEKDFFKRWYLKHPADQMLRLQKRITKRSSPAPKGREHQLLKGQILRSIEADLLYGSWNQKLPKEYSDFEGHQTWGELLVAFNADNQMREHWVLENPASLPFLKKLMERWAWEDSSVRAITIVNEGLENEYWTLERSDRKGVPNKFTLSRDKDTDGLIDLEFNDTVFFNRISKIKKVGEAHVYFLESIEKGRSMELKFNEDSQRFEKKLFRGADLLRKTKSDELPQRKYVGESLSLFIGPRSLQLDELQAVFKLNPDLVLALGQFGFSVTGGRAQMISVRTEGPREQLRKFTASLTDLIDFAKTTDVKTWFKQHEKLLMRVVSTGVGSENLPKFDSNKKPNAFEDEFRLSCVKFL